MSMDLFRKIMDEAATIPQITQICLTGLGEPSLDRHIVARVKYAREKKPHAFIDMFTHGGHMTPVLFDALRDAGLSSMQFSLNSVRAEQRKKIMGLDDFSKACAHIDYALMNKGSMKVEVRAVFDDENFTREDGHAFYARWGVAREGGAGQLINEGNWAGVNRDMRQFDPKAACGRALGQIYVLWNGKVTPCCFMPNEDVIWGDLSNQTIREVYNSQPYTIFREAHSDNQADKYPFCASCTRI
jgi:radical SAM protein with 4Fe4S-binding SPASM domain